MAIRTCEKPSFRGLPSLLGGAALSFLAMTAGAEAQSIDYGSLEQLFGEPVTTSVTGSPQRKGDVPATMEIISADDIRRSGATDVPGVLRHVAGIDVMQWSASQSDIGIRGYDAATSPRLLVLVDGRQVYADYFGYMPWSTLPVELANIQQIEIVKGGASALFGFNAEGGVINIVTKNPLYNDDRSASVTGGTQNLVQGSGVGTISLGDLGATRISLGARDDRDFSTFLPSAPFGSSRIPEAQVALDANTYLKLTDKMQLRIDASAVVANDNEILPTYAVARVHFGGMSILGQLSADTDYGLVQATAYTNFLQAKVQGPGLSGTVDFDNQVSVFELQDIFKPAVNHIVRVAFEYRHNTDNISPVGEGNVFYDVFSGSGMWSWAIAPTLTLTNAVRVDHLALGRDGTFLPGFPLTNQDWNRSFTQPTFNSGLVWAASDDDTLRLTIGEAAQSPSLTQFGAINQPGGTGNPALQPETVADYEVGWDHNVSAIAGQMRASLFHQESRDLLNNVGGFILFPPVPASIPINAGRSIANGFELAVKGNLPETWRWGLSYRWEDVTDTFPQGLSYQTTLTDFENTTPRHQVKANLGWADGPWEVDGYLIYQSPILGFAPLNSFPAALTRIGSYATLDGRIAYKITDNITLSLSGQNLTTAHQRQTSGPEVERRVFGWIQIGF